MAFAILPVFAQNAWTVDMVPNTRLQSNNIHVSDPDGYISDDYEMYINTALCVIRDEADVFLVCLSTIGSADPQAFRNDLFNKWGIGDKGKDNGMLMLFVEDQHSFEFETGYGIEGVLPDVKCMQIFDNTIKPYFKNGDYQGGMLAGVIDIMEAFGGTMPDYLITDLPDEEIYKTAITDKDRETMSSFYLLVMSLFVMIIPGFAFLRFAVGNKKDKAYNKKGEIKDAYFIEEKNGLKYLNEPSTTWTGSAWQGAGCAKSITFGLSAILWLFVVSVVILAAMPDPEQELAAHNWIAVITIFCYFTWICFRHNRRTLKMAAKVAQGSLRPKMVYEKAKNYPRTKMVNFLAYWIGWHYIKKYDKLIAQSTDLLCPDCHQPMTEEATVQLSAIEEAEQAHEAYKFTSVRCPSGHAFVVKEKGKSYKAYSECEKCGARLKKFVKNTVIEKATYTHSGLDHAEYECEFCHDKTIKKVIVPKLERVTTTSSSSGSYHSSSRSSGGSFGGGRSGGGGYSGKW